MRRDLVDLIGDFGDDDLLAIALAHVLDRGFGANLETAAACAEGVEDSLAAEDETAGGKVRALDDFHDLVELRFGMADQKDGGVDDFAQVVRRNVGRHADRDAGRSVDQKVGNARGKNFGLEFAFVVVGAEIDGFLVDVFEQRGGDAGEAGFGVPHGRGRIAIDGTEIALAIDQRIAHGEILRHADERIVDRGVAVRVEFAEDFADDFGALAGGAVGRQTHFAHAEKNAAVDGFEAVADVGKGASHDHAHGVIDVRALHLVFDVDVDIAVVVVAARRLPEAEFAEAQAGPAGDFPGQPCFLVKS